MLALGFLFHSLVHHIPASQIHYLLHVLHIAMHPELQLHTYHQTLMVQKFYAQLLNS